MYLHGKDKIKTLNMCMKLCTMYNVQSSLYIVSYTYSEFLFYPNHVNTFLVPDDYVVTSKMLDLYHINPVSSLKFAKRITKIIKLQSLF